MSRRASVSLGAACDNRCVFCAADGLPDPPDPLGALEAARAAGAREVVFVGGEPSTSPLLPEAIARAGALGFQAIGVQSNGRGLDSARAVGALRALGLTDVHLSIHAHRADAHEHLTGRPGSFSTVTAALRATRAAALPVFVTSVLTRSTFRGLSELADALPRAGVAAWQIAAPRVAGRLREGFDAVYPRLGLALPHALHALGRARAGGLPTFVGGAPLCALGPLAAHALRGPAGAYPEQPCSACAARLACPGVDPTYLARFGGDELRARDAVELEPAPSAFVGPGELALPARPEDPLPSGRRRALPVLP